METVEIYTTPTCPFCHAAMEFFKENKIQYKEHDITSDETARQWMEEHGYSGVPVIVVGKKEIYGFGPEEKEQVRKLLMSGKSKN